MRFFNGTLATGVILLLACTEQTAVTDLTETVPEFGIAYADIAPSCGDVITEHARLTADVTGCTGHGLQLGADGIELDCDGHTISSVDETHWFTHGIFLGGISGATVKNCYVHGFHKGIVVGSLDGNSADHNNVIDNTVENYAEWGIELFEANNNLINGNALQSPRDLESPDHNVIGIRLSQSTGNVVKQNSTDGNMEEFTYGILLLHSDNNRLLGNTAVGNRWFGIHVDHSHDSHIEDNTATGIRNGILLAGSNNNVITGNTAHGEIGISLWEPASFDNRIEGNDLSGNDRTGVLITHASQRNIVENNLINDNGWAGLELRDASHNRIQNNTINGNPRGITSWDANPSLDAHHNAFVQNTIAESQRPIDLQDCSNEVIVGNEIVTNECVSPGIRLYRCSDSDITDNIITKTGNHAHGIRLERASNDNTVARNTVHGSGEWGSYGIFVYGSDRNRLVDNSLTETGAGGGCDDASAFSICGAYRADDNSGAFLVDADDNTVTGNTMDIRQLPRGWSNAVRLGGSANYCEGEANNVIADNHLTGAVGVHLRNTPTNTHVLSNLINGRGEGTGVLFRPSSGNTLRGNTITGFDRGLLFREASADNLVEHNNVYANGLAADNQQTSAVNLQHNYWGTPCPPAALFEEATGSIYWFPQLESLYPPAIVAEDENGDGVADVCSRCPETGPEIVPTELLLVGHHVEIDGDGVFETNVGSAASPDIVNSRLTLADTYGCTCGQILGWKPGNIAGELMYGCAAGTMITWISQIGWAAQKEN